MQAMAGTEEEYSERHLVVNGTICFNTKFLNHRYHRYYR